MSSGRKSSPLIGTQANRCPNSCIFSCLWKATQGPALCTWLNLLRGVTFKSPDYRGGSWVVLCSFQHFTINDTDILNVAVLYEESLNLATHQEHRTLPAESITREGRERQASPQILLGSPASNLILCPALLRVTNAGAEKTEHGS